DRRLRAGRAGGRRVRPRSGRPAARPLDRSVAARAGRPGAGGGGAAAAGSARPAPAPVAARPTGLAAAAAVAAAPAAGRHPASAPRQRCALGLAAVRPELQPADGGLAAGAPAQQRTDHARHRPGLAAGLLTIAAPWLMRVPALHDALAALGCRPLP